MSIINSESKTQVYYSALVGTTALCTGIGIAWSSAAVSYLMTRETGFRITSDEASWVVSLLNLGCILSSFFTRFTLDYWGRRGTMLSAGIMYMVSWILLIYGNHVWYIYIGRIFGGLGFGTTIACCIFYVGEICHKNIRGALCMILVFMSNFGYIIGYTTGVCTSYLTYNYIYAAMTFILFTVFYMFVPETPYFYIKNKNKYAAEKTLQKLRNYKNERHITEEIEEIERIIQADMKNKSSLKELFTNKLYRKSLLINITLNVAIIASGNFIITSYIQTIIEKVGINISPKVIPIVYGCLQMTIGILPAFILDKFGRKKLLLMSLAGVVIAQLSLGIYFFIHSHLELKDEMTPTLNLMPFAALLLFCFCYNIGVCPVILVLEGELYPTNVKAVGLSAGTVITHVLSITFVKFYQVFSDIWGLYLPFWIFSIILLFAIVFLVLNLPETKGKSFDLIQEELKKNSFFKW